MTAVNKFFNAQKSWVTSYGELISDGKLIKLTKYIKLQPHTSLCLFNFYKLPKINTPKINMNLDHSSNTVMVRGIHLNKISKSVFMAGGFYLPEGFKHFHVKI